MGSVHPGDKIQGQPEKARPQDDRLRGAQQPSFREGPLRRRGGRGDGFVAPSFEHRSTSCSPPFHATFAMPDQGWDTICNCKSLAPSPSQARVAGWRWRETNAPSRSPNHLPSKIPSPARRTARRGQTDRRPRLRNPATQRISSPWPRSSRCGPTIRGRAEREWPGAAAPPPPQPLLPKATSSGRRTPPATAEENDSHAPRRATRTARSTPPRACISAGGKWPKVGGSGRRGPWQPNTQPRQPRPPSRLFDIPSKQPPCHCLSGRQSTGWSYRRQEQSGSIDRTCAMAPFLGECQDHGGKHHVHKGWDSAEVRRWLPSPGEKGRHGPERSGHAVGGVARNRFPGEREHLPRPLERRDLGRRWADPPRPMAAG